MTAYSGPEQYRFADQEIEASHQTELEDAERLVHLARAQAHAIQGLTAAILDTAFDLHDDVAKTWRGAGAIS